MKISIRYIAPRFYAGCVLGLLYSMNSVAEQEFRSNSIEGVSNIAGWERILSSYEFVLSLLIVILGIIIIFLQYRLFSLRQNGFESDDVLKVNSITIILIGGLLFVTASYDAEQIAPAVGLFGTIAGYLLGKNGSSGKKGDE